MTSLVTSTTSCRKVAVVVSRWVAVAVCTSVASSLMRSATLWDILAFFFLPFCNSHSRIMYNFFSLITILLGSVSSSLKNSSIFSECVWDAFLLILSGIFFMAWEEWCECCCNWSPVFFVIRVPRSCWPRRILSSQANTKSGTGYQICKGKGSVISSSVSSTETISVAWVLSRSSSVSTTETISVPRVVVV